ncbi:class I adenylate-forming enzyme family protein, partial [Aminicella lysinilytica]
ADYQALRGLCVNARKGADMPITQYLERNAREWPNEVALVALNPTISVPKLTTWKEYDLMEPDKEGPYRKEITWRVFDEKANRVANCLIARGVTKGEKVGILLMNCLDWLPIYFGILKAGAVAVPLNFRYTSDEIQYCVDQADVSILIFGPEFIGRIEEIVDTLSKRRLLFYVGATPPSFAENFIVEMADYPSMAPDIILSDDDYAAIYFSSGTTGFPKAILHKHSGLMHSAKAEQKHHGQKRGDVFLCIPPLYHTGAKMHWFGSLISGTRAVLLRGTTPDIILKAISDERCTIVWLLVPWAQDILDALDSDKVEMDDYRLSQWRLMHIGAQPVPPSMIKRWREYFPDQDYDTNYGLSESLGPGCLHLGVENIDKVGAVGIPGYGWEAQILDEDHEPVAEGEVGELAVRGPSVMCCYYHDPDATKATLGRDGWLYTGDMAKKDEDGFYYLVDRKKDVIISGGENIYPVQIENYLHAFDPVKDVAVIGLPDKRLGEISAAIIELKEGYDCTEGEVREYCMKLPKYKRPVKVIFADVPRNPTGKIEKPKLREFYGASNLVAAENEVDE